MTKNTHAAVAAKCTIVCSMHERLAAMPALPYRDRHFMQSALRDGP